MIEDKRIGDKIRSNRERRNMTPAALAAKCGCSKGYIEKVEAGHKSASIDLLNRIGRILNVGISIVFAEKE